MLSEFNTHLACIIVQYNAKNCFLLFPQTILRVCEIPDIFRVYVEAVDDGTLLPPHSFTATSIYANRNITLTFHTLNNELPSNRLYSVVIEYGNKTERINSTGVIQLSELVYDSKICACEYWRYVLKHVQKILQGHYLYTSAKLQTLNHAELKLYRGKPKGSFSMTLLQLPISSCSACL